jgi:hypothetical protein
LDYILKIKKRRKKEEEKLYISELEGGEGTRKKLERKNKLEIITIKKESTESNYHSLLHSPLSLLLCACTASHLRRGSELKEEEKERDGWREGV